ncbi:MAG: hypothetical protein HFE30_06990 [Clostridiales bacterium]|nr:hypothetical protein [Clostridiales bacterium]
MNIKITAVIKEGTAWLETNGESPLRVTVADEKLCVCLYYSFREEPLHLNADIKAGDRIEIKITDIRIELFVNEELRDEEWPAGKISLCSESLSCGDFALSTVFFEREAKDAPLSSIRHNVKIEDIRKNGINIGDCMPYSYEEDTGARGDGRYHLFFLRDRHHHGSKWGLGAHQWAHISTDNFQTWEEHPMAVPVEAQYEGSICTGSVIYAEGKYYAWYSVRMYDSTPARFKFSVSENGINFKKSEDYFIVPNKYQQIRARDPKIIFFDRKYHMFITTNLISNGKGCLAHLVSDKPDMSNYKDLGAMIEYDGCEHPECPDWFKIGDYFYLVFSIDGVARYAYSKEPFSNWRFPNNNAIWCGLVPKSAIFGGKRIFAGFTGDGGYGGDVVFCEAKQQINGELRFEYYDK